MVARPLPRLPGKYLAAISPCGARHSRAVCRLCAAHRRNLANTGRCSRLFSFAWSCSHGLANHVVAGCVYAAGIAVAFLLRVFAPGNQFRSRVAMHVLGDAAIAAALFLTGLDGSIALCAAVEGLGLGDVKLLAMIAAFLGLAGHTVCVFCGVLAAALFADHFAGAAQSSRHRSHSIWKFSCRRRHPRHFHRQAGDRMVSVNVSIAQRLCLHFSG